jgi:hypothetical protein
MQSYQYLLPATHWVAHMASGLLWVNQNSVPQPTIDALKRRKGQGHIYLSEAHSRSRPRSPISSRSTAR